jgi:hypothetical protein
MSNIGDRERTTQNRLNPFFVKDPSNAQRA